MGLRARKRRLIIFMLVITLMGIVVSPGGRVAYAATEAVRAPAAEWEQVNVDGFGDPATNGVSALEVFQGQLYVGATNGNVGAQVWRWERDGQWQQVSETGFGSGSANAALIDMIVFRGQLYAGMGWNQAPGQVWRSDDGTSWGPVTTDGFGDVTEGDPLLTDFGGGYLRDPEFQRVVVADTPLGRVGEPEDVAGVIASLLSPDTRWVTGQRIEVTGGCRF